MPADAAFTLHLLQQLGYTVLSPAQLLPARGGADGAVLTRRLQAAIKQLNPECSGAARARALRQVLQPAGASPVANNGHFHQLLVNGVPAAEADDGESGGGAIRLIDTDEVWANRYAVGVPYRGGGAAGEGLTVVLFINGLPLVVMELAAGGTAWPALRARLREQCAARPALFHYSAALVISDGWDAQAGVLTAAGARFTRWPAAVRRAGEENAVPPLETLVKGMLPPPVLLDLIKHFTWFERDRSEWIGKKMASGYQYHAVQRAVRSTLRAAAGHIRRAGAGGTSEPPADYGVPDAADQPHGDCRAGLVWHTPGSGKSLTILFYAVQVLRRFVQPLVLVVGDQHDGESPLRDTFNGAEALLGQRLYAAETPAHLRQLLTAMAGGVIFASAEQCRAAFSDEKVHCRRGDVIVIVDEVQRERFTGGAPAAGGLAQRLRRALPWASFIGFTALPLDGEDTITPAVFGDYVDVYDIQQAVDDGVTVKIFHQSRSLPPEAAVGGSAGTARVSPARLEAIAADIIAHFSARRQVLEGKGMVVGGDRRMAVALYEQMVRLKPHWSHADKDRGMLKLVMAPQADEPAAWQRYYSDRRARLALYRRFAAAAAEPALLIVCDCWLTALDVPCLHTLYLVKPLRGHALMQVMARVNRGYQDKPGGLVVDYIGMTAAVRRALAVYRASGRRGHPAYEHSEVIALLRKKYREVTGLLAGTAYREYFGAAEEQRRLIMLRVQEHLLTVRFGQSRFIREAEILSQAFALALPAPLAVEIRDEVIFFQRVRQRLQQFAGGSGGAAGEETILRQPAGKAADIFAAAGMDKPAGSVLNDDFLRRLRAAPHKNLALQLLQKLLRDEIAAAGGKNYLRGIKLAEQVSAVAKAYQNNLLTAARAMQALLPVIERMKTLEQRDQALTALSAEEVAFYDILADHAGTPAGEGPALQPLARALAGYLRQPPAVDWPLKTAAQAEIRVGVKRLLREYGYPAGSAAVENILKQAALGDIS